MLTLVCYVVIGKWYPIILAEIICFFAVLIELHRECLFLALVSLITSDKEG